MAYRIAGVDVHKKMLAVVVADVEGESEYQFERRQFGTTPEHLRLLSEWFVELQVEEVVMESTAQYWKPVWGALERYWKPNCQKWEGVKPDVRSVASVTGAIESRVAGSEERLSRCRATGEAARVPGADLELCAPIPNSDCGGP